MRVALLKMDAARSGGLEKVTRRIHDAFQALSCSVTLVSPPAKNYLFSFQKVAAFDRHCKEFMSHEPHDVVLGMDRTRFQTHIRAGNGIHAAYLAIRRHKEGSLKNLSFALNPLHKLLLQIEKEAFESPELRKVIVNSNLVKGQLLEHYKIDPRKIVVIHNGVEWQEWGPHFENSFTQPKEGPYEFLFVGHDFERKGLGILLHALERIKKEEFHLTVVGSDRKIASFQKLTLELGLDQKVTFAGKQKESHPFYQKADCLVIPSFYDPFANVTVEALAMGLFVITSSMNGGSEVLRNDTGIIADGVDALAAALKKSIAVPKIKMNAEKIRASVSHLDYSQQLTALCNVCLT